MSHESVFLIIIVVICILFCNYGKFSFHNVLKSAIHSESMVLNPSFDLSFKFLLAWTIDPSEKFNLQMTFVHKSAVQCVG